MSNHSMQIIPDGVEFFADVYAQKLNGINTFDDWHLMPTSRIVIAPPAPKTNYIDLPGANGSIDASEALIGHPVYSDRTGSIEFYVLNGKSMLSENRRDQTWTKYGTWNSRYSEIMDYLHGRSMVLILDDDREYYYRGRLSVNQWKSDKTWSKITFDYTLDPFKYEMFGSLDDWLWDPFSFIDGIARNKADYMFTVGPTGDSHTLIIPIRSMPVSPFFVLKATNLINGQAKIKINKWSDDHTTVIKTRDVTLSDTATHSYRFWDIELLAGENKIGVRVNDDASTGTPGATVDVKIDFVGGRF